MFSYSRILKDSYRITVRYPVLWVFGLFVLGGFNLNLLNFQEWPIEGLNNKTSFAEVLLFFQNHPGILVLSGLALLFLFAVGLVLASWSRIMLVLSVQSILETKTPKILEQAKKSKAPLWPVIKVSLLTTALLLVVIFGLLGAPFWWIANVSSQSLMWAIGGVIFIPLAFTVFCINIFTSFFIILFKQAFGKALNLGTDFFITNWNKILGLAVVLAVIYVVSFVSGLAVFYLVNLSAKFVSDSIHQFGSVAEYESFLLISKVITGVFLWVLFAGLNVFFNAALLILFLQLTTPIKDEKEEAKKMLISPAAPV